MSIKNFQILNGKYYINGDEIKRATYFRRKKEYQDSIKKSQKVSKPHKSNQSRTRQRSLADELTIIKYKWDMRYNFKYYNILERMYRYKEVFHNLLIKNTKRLREYCECTKQEAYVALKLYNKDVK